MKEQIQDLIAHSRTEEALQILGRLNNDAVLLQARYNNGKKQYNMGLIDFGEWQKIQNQTNFAILEMVGGLNSTTTTTMQIQNPLIEFDRLFEDDIEPTIKGLAITEQKIRRWIDKFTAIFNMPQVFVPFLDPLETSGFKLGTSAEKTQILGDVANKILQNKDRWRIRLQEVVQKNQSETDFKEAIQNFLGNPTVKNWNTCKEKVAERLSDKTLYGPDVQIAWNEWQNKFAQFDDLDFGFEMVRGTQTQSDFLRWLQTNLQLKNFNY